MTFSYLNLRILELLSRGMTDAEIGEKVNLSTKAVSSRLSRIYRQLGVRNRVEAVAALRKEKQA